MDSFLAVAANLYLSRWSSDLNFWFTSEAGYIDIPDRFFGTSRVMMQKKNPYALEYTRDAVADSMGGMVATFGAMKAATGEANQDRRYLVFTCTRRCGSRSTSPSEASSGTRRCCPRSR